MLTFASGRTMPRILASFAIASIGCIAATAACARELPQPPCAVDIGCMHERVTPRPPDAALGRLPGYADPAERDGATSPIAASDVRDAADLEAAHAAGGLNVGGVAFGLADQRARDR